MENNQGILNLTEKNITFKFNDEDFIMDLTEGDIDDNWNSFVDKEGVIRDLNFWLEAGGKPYLSIYPVINNADDTFSTDVDWLNAISVELIEIIGSEEEYFK